MERLFSRLTDQQADTYRLVLDASGIPYRMNRRLSGWVMEIPQAYRSAAVGAIRLYLRENVESPTPREAPVPPAHKTFSAVYVVAALATLNGALQSGFERNVFVKAYGADAGAILSGQLYRCVTALLFHADWAHLAANAVGLLIFGTAVAATVGWGIGWLLIMLCGAGGNLLTALWYGRAHLSIGSSTAVFAAVGLSAAFTMVLHIGQERGFRRAWLPLAGGLALLGFMGASPNTDLLAHLFGFCCGFLVGGLFCWRVPRRQPWQAQLCALAALVLILGGSWILGLQS